MKHVLVVDDEPAMRDVISSYLESENFQVSAPADGKTMMRILATAVDMARAIPS